MMQSDTLSLWLQRRRWRAKGRFLCKERPVGVESASSIRRRQRLQSRLKRSASGLPQATTDGRSRLV